MAKKTTKSKVVRYVITEKGLKQITTFFGGWRITSLQTEMLDILKGRRQTGLTKDGLIRKTNLADDPLAQKELSLNLRRLLQKGMVKRIIK